MIKNTEHIIISMNRSGVMNFSQVFKLTLTNAKEGKINPVGATNDMIPIPIMYEFTISLPGIFTMMANAPMIGIVNTAIPELD